MDINTKETLWKKIVKFLVENTSAGMARTKQEGDKTLLVMVWN